MKTIRCLLFLAIAAVAARANDTATVGYPAHWTALDTALELAAEAGLYTEWQQMRDISRHPHDFSACGIDQKVFNAHPKMRNVDKYFEAWMIVHPIISFALPKPYREIWQGGTIAFEIIVTSQNAAVAANCQW